MRRCEVRRCEDEKMWSEKMWRWGCEVRRCDDEKMWRWEDAKMRGKPPLLEEPCAQTLSGKINKGKGYTKTLDRAWQTRSVCTGCHHTLPQQPRIVPSWDRNRFFPRSRNCNLLRGRAFPDMWWPWHVNCIPRHVMARVHTNYIPFHFHCLPLRYTTLHCMTMHAHMHWQLHLQVSSVYVGVYKLQLNEFTLSLRHST